VSGPHTGVRVLLLVVVRLALMVCL
jgi:hypothetical protein